MVLRAALAGRVFLEEPEAGDGLAGIEQGAGRAAITHRGHVSAGQGGDARKVLHDVQGAALCREKRAGAALDAHQIGAGLHRVAIAHQHFEGAIRVEVAEECFGQREPRDDDGIAAVHHPGEARVCRDDALRGNVPPAAGEALTQVLGERFADELGEVEAGEGELGHQGILRHREGRMARGDPWPERSERSVSPWIASSLRSSQ